MTEAGGTAVAGLGDVFERVLRLQAAWSSSNTAEMKQRGLLVRRDGVEIVRRMLQVIVPDPPFDVQVEGRDGTGLKTRVPWLRIYSKTRSPRATDGWYVVYLFSFDGTGVYLSLMQGTTMPGTFTMKPAHQLADRVTWARAALEAAGADVIDLTHEMNLADPGLGRGYERGNVAAIRYERDAMPDDAQLKADLKRMVELLSILYQTHGEPAAPTADVEAAPQASRPPIDDIPGFIAWVRSVYGATLVASRRAAEQQAHALLDEFSGAMTVEQALHLGELFNTGEWGGIVRHNRFSPAFVGATMRRVAEPIDAFNEWTDRLWRRPEDEALQTVDEILRNAHAFPGAGRSYPTMLMYLRDPTRYVIWLQVTHLGLVALGRLDESRARAGGTERYRRYCEAAHGFAGEFGLEPQEIDAVLSEIARASADESKLTAAEIASLVVDGDDDEPEAHPRQRAEYLLTQVAASTHLSSEQLEEWVTLLRGRKRQALFFGPPGTGKTFVAEQLARHLAGAEGDIEVVQFHPSFSYEDFVEGLRPTPTEGGTIGYTVRPGVFKLFCERARRGQGTYVFIIDEINRAELGAVLGELMLLLEYRGRSIVLPYSQETFSVPDNLILLATMNTADRSLALVDFALRRRFHAFEMLPNKEVLRRHLTERGDPAEPALEFFDIVQTAIANDDFSPGHSYWMAEDVTAQGLFRIWRYELLPYLSEYWFEHPSRLKDLDQQIASLLSEEA